MAEPAAQAASRRRWSLQQRICSEEADSDMVPLGAILRKGRDGTQLLWVGCARSLTERASAVSTLPRRWFSSICSEL